MIAMTSLTVWGSHSAVAGGDRWFDEAFADLVSGDGELVRADRLVLVAAPGGSARSGHAEQIHTPPSAPSPATAVPKRAPRRGGDGLATEGCQRSPQMR